MAFLISRKIIVYSIIGVCLLANYQKERRKGRERKRNGGREKERRNEKEGER